MTALATRLWQWAAPSRPAQQAVRVLAKIAEGAGGRPRALLEATGPDMPFLVDSLLGACAVAGP